MKGMSGTDDTKRDTPRHPYSGMQFPAKRSHRQGMTRTIGADVTWVGTWRVGTNKRTPLRRIAWNAPVEELEAW